MNVVLDTSFVIRWFRDDLAAERALVSVEKAYINVVTLGELLVGDLYAVLNEVPRDPIDVLRMELQVFPIDEATASIYARIQFQLERAGKKISPNDVWIASTAVAHGMTLLTFDQHFQRVEGLDVKVY